MTPTPEHMKAAREWLESRNSAPSNQSGVMWEPLEWVDNIVRPDPDVESLATLISSTRAPVSETSLERACKWLDEQNIPPLPEPRYMRQRITSLAAEFDAAVAGAWRPIATIPDCDDMIWLCRGNTFTGPRVLHGDEADYWDWWCYAKPPSLPPPPRAAGEDGR